MRASIFMPCLYQGIAEPLEILRPSSHLRFIRRGLRADIGKMNMTLFYTHHDRRHGPAVFSFGRALRRMRTGLKRIHRAIAAAKIRRLRNELRLHAATRADRFPRQPVHLGDKWDF